MVAASVAIVVLTATLAYVLSNLDTFFQLLGKDATLTARVPIWKALLAMSVNHRWLGYGFDGFWTKNLVNVKWILGGFAPGKAHNGFIDLMLELGLFGLGIFALAAIVAFRRAIQIIARERTLESEWPLLILTLILLYNAFESDLVAQNGFLWVLFVAVSVSAQRAWSLSRATVPVLVENVTPLSAVGYEPCPQ
jgi:O-antigen ligase